MLTRAMLMLSLFHRPANIIDLLVLKYKDKHRMADRTTTAMGLAQLSLRSFFLRVYCNPCSLGSNNIDATGATALAEALKHNKSVKSIK